MTKDNLIDLLNENIIKHNNPEEFKKLLTLSDDEEITGKEEVFRGVGPLRFKLDNYMK